jgi:hypothetical protein
MLLGSSSCTVLRTSINLSPEESNGRSVSGEGHLTVNFPPPKEASTSTRLSSDSGAPTKIR